VLSKGFEVELYTGISQGDIVGLSDQIVALSDEFTCEPDSRNIEYITAPSVSYDQLLCDLLRPRLRLRNHLKQLGDYTLVPGSTLSLGGSDRFFRSNPDHPYHTYIEQTYRTAIVTTSVHINIGIPDPELLMRACRLIRVEAPLYLALSASSPFLDGKATGFHSTRWHLFPQTPAYVPLFESHAHYIQWMETQIRTGTMQNVRHLWNSVRPNGDRRPYDLNRLELRICDLVSDPSLLLAITALLEARLLQLMQDPSLDPLEASLFPAANRAQDLVSITNANEAAVAIHSLDAQLRHWRDGHSILARDWITQMYWESLAIAQQHGFDQYLTALPQILYRGNQAQQWLQQHALGATPHQIVAQAVQSMQLQEQELEIRSCTPVLACV